MKPISPEYKRYVIMYLLFWLAVGTVYEALFLLTASIEVWTAIYAGLQVVGFAALLGIGVVFFAARGPMLKDRPLLLTVAHILGALTYSLVWVATIAALRNAELYFSSSDYQPITPPFFVVRWHLIAGTALYLVMIAAVYAMRATTYSEHVRQQAELRALRAQLNPHFLFNALHTITMLFRSDPAKAERAMETFSDLIRYALHGGDASDSRMRREGNETHSVSLGQEWEIVEKYISLEKLRLEDRLRVSMHANPDVMDVRIPSLILQPLVENAVVHAASVSENGATVYVTVDKSGSDTVIRVENDGVPASRHSETKAVPGVGLGALSARLKNMFGDTVVCSFLFAEGGRFIATISFPSGKEPAI